MTIDLFERMAHTTYFTNILEESSHFLLPCFVVDEIGQNSNTFQFLHIYVVAVDSDPAAVVVKSDVSVGHQLPM